MAKLKDISENDFKELEKYTNWKLSIELPPMALCVPYTEGLQEYLQIAREAIKEHFKNKQRSKLTETEEIESIRKISKRVMSETGFLFHGKRLPYLFSDVKIQYGTIFVEFYLITDVETFKEIREEIFFDGVLADSDIRMKCYHTSMQMYDLENGKLKVGILGEAKL